MSTRRLSTIVRGLTAVACSLPALAHAQQMPHLGPVTRDGEPRFMGGADFTIAMPAGQFGQYVDDGIGVGAHGLVRLGGSGAFALRVDGSFVQYGRETKRV